MSAPPAGSKITLMREGVDEVLRLPHPARGAMSFLVAAFLVFWLGGWVMGLLSLSTAAFAQSLSYQDADTPSEAVGMMHTTLVSSRKMLSECARRFPAQEDEMSRDLRTWEETERSVILKTRYFWAQMSKRDPKLIQFNEYVERAVLTNIDNLANAPFDQATKVLSDYCRKHFADLASGVWRTRTPKAYSFLDQAPQPPAQK